MLSMKDALGALGSDGKIDMERLKPDRQQLDEDSEDEAPLSAVAAAAAAQQPSTAFLAPPSLSLQVADCKSKVEQLQAWKAQRLKEDDYMGAHHVHQLIQEQEQKLQGLRRQLDAMPTPARSGQVSQSANPRAAKVQRVGAAESEAKGVKRSSSSREGSGCSAMSPQPVLRPAPSGLTPISASPAPPQRQPGSSRREVERSPLAKVSPDVPAASEQDEAPMDGPRDAVPEEEVGNWRTVDEFVELASDAIVPHPFRLPSDTFEKLYGYQRTGVAWMARHWQKKQGGILADEMGLGKTVQVCAFLNGARKAGATHALLILPVSLLNQWAKETRRWCPGWPVYTYHGTSVVQKARALRRVSRPQGGILLASYGGLSSAECLFQVDVEDPPTPKRRGRKPGQAKHRKLDDDDEPEDGDESDEDEREPESPPGGYRAVGQKMAWDIVVCDEAHRMKNISTLLGKSLRRLQADCRILLTGTPVQNALGDLWALLDFAKPMLLGNHATFIKKFSNPIDQGSVRGATPFQVQLKKHLSGQLRQLMDPYVLRRTKKDAGLLGGSEENVEEEEEEVEGDAQVKKLPPKRETLVWLQPSAEQTAIYRRVLEDSDVIREAAEKGKLGIEVFRAIGMLKRLCNHPMLLVPTKAASEWRNLLAETDKGIEAPAEGGDAEDGVDSSALGGAAALQDEDEDVCAGNDVETMLQKMPRSLEAVSSQSAKLRCMSSMLPALASKGHRTLVFSASVKMLDLIQICCLKPHGLKCLRIDGQTDIAERAVKVDKFNRETSRFQFMLLTTKVGGVGLNLTSANRVVMVDPDWNPATDAQAVDRAFRIGQQREVRVYRLVMSGLIEDKMFRLQVFKMALSKTALESDSQQHRYFSNREIKALFEWCDPAEGDTRKLLDKEHVDDDGEAVQQAASEDGSATWLAAGPAVGMSDFNLLFNSVAQEEEPDDMCAAQVTEAQHKLGAADEKSTRMAGAKEEAIANFEAVGKELEEANSALEFMKEKKSQSDELVKERRRELVQARKTEDAAHTRQEKTSGTKAKAEEQEMKAQNSLTDAREGVELAAKSAADIDSQHRTAEDTFAKALADTEAQLGIVNESGKATKDGNVDVPVAKLRTAAKALDKVRTAADIANVRRSELEVADKEVLKADDSLAEAEAFLVEMDLNRGRESKGSGAPAGAEMQAVLEKKKAELAVKNKERERKFAEQSQGKALQKLESAREAVSKALDVLSEAWSSFVDDFQKPDGKKVTVEQVKKTQVAAKAAARQMASVWLNGKKVRESSAKLLGIQRKAAQKLSAALASELEASRSLSDADSDFVEARTEAENKLALRGAAEAELMTAEENKLTVEQEDVAAKKRKDYLKTQLPIAKEAIKAAKSGEKEAENERRQLHSACSKVEKAAKQMEEAANTAVSSLQSEAYKPGQVLEAYERSKNKDN